MLNNLSEKYKFFLAVSGFIVLLFISYQLAIKSTVRLRQDFKELKSKYTEADELPQQIAKYQQELKRINNKYFENQNPVSDNHELILEKISDVAADNNVFVHEFPPRHVVEAAGVTVESHEMILRGEFKSLLKTLHALETETRVGRLKSVKFYTELDRKTKRNYLYAQLYIQNYSNSRK